MAHRVGDQQLADPQGTSGLRPTKWRYFLEPEVPPPQLPVPLPSGTQALYIRQSAMRPFAFVVVRVLGKLRGVLACLDPMLDFFEATFDFVERILRLVAFDKVASTLVLVWTGLNATAVLSSSSSEDMWRHLVNAITTRRQRPAPSGERRYSYTMRDKRRSSSLFSTSQSPSTAMP